MPLDLWAPIGLVATSYAATNLDNLALLVGSLLGSGDHRGRVLAGHLLGMLSLLLLSFAFGLGAALFPVESIGYLGVVPIVLGLKGIRDLRRARAVAGSLPTPARGRSLSLSIAATQVANGVDTVLVFGPLLADSERSVDLVLIAGFGGMVLAWYGLARLLVHHAGRLSFVERYGPWISPVVLIGVGLYILENTVTDVMPGG